MDDIRKPPVGSKPGTLVMDPDSPRPVIRLVRYGLESIEETEITDVAELRRIRGDGGDNLWIDVQGLGDESVLRALAEIFSIHPLALEDIVHAPIRPKTEPYDEHLFIVSRMLRHSAAGEGETEQVCVFLGSDYLLTFQEAYGDVLEPVRKRIQVPVSMLRRSGPDYLAYAILDTIIDAYFPVIERLGDEIELLEERVLEEASEDCLRELNRIRTTLVSLRRAVVPQREAINTLVRDDSRLVTPTVRTYLRDTYDHVVQTAEAVEVSREMVNGLMNTYLTVLSNRMNEIMKVLTIVASIFVPLTFMAGIYGMNFEYMPELGLGWAYPTLLVVMAVVAIGMVLFFRKRGWLGGDRE